MGRKWEGAEHVEEREGALGHERKAQALQAVESQSHVNYSILFEYKNAGK